MEVPSNPTKGETANVTVTDSDGSPAAGQVSVTAPDGRMYYVSLVEGVASIVLDQSGIWSLSYTDPNGKTVARTMNVTEPAEEIQPGGQPPRIPREEVNPDSAIWMIAAAAIIAILVALFIFMRSGRSSKQSFSHEGDGKPKAL
jgi:hypothetical protein